MNHITKILSKLTTTDFTHYSRITLEGVSDELLEKLIADLREAKLIQANLVGHPVSYRLTALGTDYLENQKRQEHLKLSNLWLHWMTVGILLLTFVLCVLAVVAWVCPVDSNCSNGHDRQTHQHGLKYLQKPKALE